MKTIATFAAALLAASLALPAVAQESPVLQGTKDTRIGKIEFDLGFPSKRAVDKLFPEVRTAPPGSSRIFVSRAGGSAASGWLV